MDQLRWQRINRIFHAALELPPSERKAFVVAQSGGDPDLCLEVVRLIEADQHVEDYLESPLLPSLLFSSFSSSLPTPGTVLSARFEIIRLVGEGGMGHVFEARDFELGVTVALKVIRPEISTHSEAVARFRQEVRLAQQITHPNICRTNDLNRAVITDRNGHERMLLFLTMEFLAGESLAARLKRTGRIPADEARAIAAQLAAGLEAAHALGVIHRDIKPANIQLVPTPRGPCSPLRTVITDFGLARLDSIWMEGDLFSPTSTPRPIGTLSYMAPEQLEGGAVSPATDIYAFGLILFEMATGMRAFPSNNLLDGVLQRLKTLPPSATAIVPSLPSEWEEAIQGCLKLAPEQRFQNATEVVGVLAGGPRPRPSSSSPVLQTSEPRKSTRWSSQRRISLVVSVASLLVSLFAASLRYYKLGRENRVEAGATVYLAPVRNQTGEPALDNLSHLIHEGLTQSMHINVLGEGRVGDILQEMTKSPEFVIDGPTAREIAMRAGAARIIFVTLDQTVGNYKLEVEIQQPDNTPIRYREHWQHSFPWRSSEIGSAKEIPASLLAAIRSSSEWIRRETGESANDIARLDVPPENATTKSWAALQNYAEGEKLARANRNDSAIVMFQHAVEDDSDFALAWARMGDLLLSLNRDIEGYKAYDKALDAAQQNRLTHREEDRIRGMRAVDVGDYQLAVDAFHDYTVYYPNDINGWIYATLPLRMLGRDQEAIANLRRAIALDPSPFATYSIAQELILQGSYEEASEWLRRLRPKHPDLADNLETAILLLNEHYDQAREKASSLVESDNPIRKSYRYEMQASLAADRGDYRHAIGYLNQGLEQDKRQGNKNQAISKLLHRAYLEPKIGELDNCLQDVRSAVNLDNSPSVISRAASVLGIAYSDAPLRWKYLIRRELAALSQTSAVNSTSGAIFEFAKLRIQGEILLARGRPRAAVEMFKKAAIKDAPAESREYLGRALVMAASEGNSLQTDHALQQALQAYAAVALRPAWIWTNLGNYFPGFYRDQLESYVQIAGKLRIRNSEVSRAEARLKNLRGEPKITRKGL